MENSKAYSYLIGHINATGREKLDGYYPHIMEEIYEWERDNVEDIIWNTFNNKMDFDLAEFLPKLRNYDGIGILKQTLRQCNIPSDNSVNIAKVLYECTSEKYYLEVIKLNIERDRNKTSYVAILSYCKPSEELYQLLVDIYIESDNTIVTSSAALGILYNKGFINNPHNLDEIMGKSEMWKTFAKPNIKDRKDLIKNLEKGQVGDWSNEGLLPSN